MRNTTSQPRTAGIRRWMLVGAVAAASILGFAAPAQAHNFVVSSTPEDGQTLTELPETFVVTTNDDLLDLGENRGFFMQVTDAAGGFYGDGCVDVEGASMSTTAALGQPGDYTMTWQLISADSHTVSGEFAFTWAPTDTNQISEPLAEAPVCGVAAPTPEATEAPVTPETPDAAEDPAEQPVSDDAPADDSLSTVLWIGGAVIAAAVAVVVTLLLVGRSKGKGERGTRG